MRSRPRLGLNRGRTIERTSVHDEGASDCDSAALCSIILLCQTYANAGGAGEREGEREDECACVMQAEANVEFPHTHTHGNTVQTGGTTGSPRSLSWTLV